MTAVTHEGERNANRPAWEVFPKRDEKDENQRVSYVRIIDINETYVSKGLYREAGIKFWEYGLIKEAKEQFVLSGDEMLIKLVDSCASNNSSNLNIDVLTYFEDVKENVFARNFILDVAKRDVDKLKKEFEYLAKGFDKGGINGK